jgi:tetratricopeptide (TPR) repeat protein
MSVPWRVWKRPSSSGRQPRIPTTDTLYNIGNVHRKLGDYERALAYYQRFYETGVQERFKPRQANARIAMAAVYWEQGKTDDSLRLYKDAVQMARGTGCTHGLSQALRDLGDLLLALNEAREAPAYLVEGAGTFAELGDRESAAAVWAKVAAICEQTLEDYQEACAAWEKVRTPRLQIADRHGALEALQQMGRLARRHLGGPTRALGYLRDALALALELGERAKQGELLNALAILSWQRAAYADAVAYYEQALQIYRELGDVAHAGLMLKALGPPCGAWGAMTRHWRICRSLWQPIARPDSGSLMGMG